MDTQTKLLERLGDEIAETRKNRAQARHLPGELYTSQEVASLEKAQIFMQRWLCVGRSEEISTVGDYCVRDIAGESVVLTRSASGEVNALINMCLHRGVPVTSGSGNTRRFVCPYHAWTYDLTGKLLAAPKMEDTDCDLDQAQMRRLHCTEWRGWIFINFAVKPAPFEEFIAPYEQELWWFKSDQCEVIEKLEIQVKCNWKLLVENLVDIYHVPILHKGTFGRRVSYANDGAIKLLPAGGWTYEQSAKPLSFSGTQLFPQLPWLTEDSAEISNRAGMFPNIVISTRADSMRLWQVWPVSESVTKFEIYLLFPKASARPTDFDENLKEYKNFLRNVVAEDVEMVEALQTSLKSAFYTPGPMSPLESAVHHTIKCYLQAAFPELPEVERREMEPAT